MVPVSIQVVYANITRANEEGKLTWENFIDWQEDYEIEDLRPSNILDFASRMRNDEKLAVAYKENA